MGHELCLSKVSVAADYPDSVPDSSSYMSNQAYHPLEEVKVSRRIRETKLASAEIARTTVEVCAYKRSHSLFRVKYLNVRTRKVKDEPLYLYMWGEFR